jgi:hypothetical protein
VNYERSLNAVLGQTARDLAAQFSDFDLIHDWGSLTKLGSGVLWIDLATGRTFHNGRPVERLVISEVLQSWLRESLSNVHLAKTGTQDAALVARLTIERYVGQRDMDSHWAGKPTRFVGCSAEIRCRLAVDGVSVEAERSERMEWPEPEAV